MPEPTQRETMFSGKLFRVERLTWRDGAGRTIAKDIIRHPGAVLIVPVLADGRLVMIRNRRPAVDLWLWEFPAGTAEPGEDSAHTAARELEEEAGYVAGSIEKLGEFYTTPGLTDELMRVFLARDLHPASQRLEAGENITVETVTQDRIEALVDSGELRDGKSIAAYHLFTRHARSTTRAGSLAHGMA